MVLPLCIALHNGKTRFSVGLGLKAVAAGYNVSFVSLDELMRLLKTSEISSRATSRVKAIKNSDLFILDEVGFLPISKQDAYKLYEFVNSLYLKTSMYDVDGNLIGKIYSVEEQAGFFEISSKGDYVILTSAPMVFQNKKINLINLKTGKKELIGLDTLIP